MPPKRTIRFTSPPQIGRGDLEYRTTRVGAKTTQQVKNPRTNRWIDVKGVAGKAIIEAHNIRVAPKGRASLQGGQWQLSKAVADRGQGVKEAEFRNNNPKPKNTVGELAGGIFETVRRMREDERKIIRGVKVMFIDDEENTNYRYFRTLSLAEVSTNPKAIAEIIDELQYTTKNISQVAQEVGSDVIPSFVKLVVNEFIVYYELPPPPIAVGSKGATTLKSASHKYKSGVAYDKTSGQAIFKIRDYGADNNDCLLNCLRNVSVPSSPETTFPQNKTIRSELGLGESGQPIDITSSSRDVLELLACYFNIQIALYDSDSAFQFNTQALNVDMTNEALVCVRDFHFKPFATSSNTAAPNSVKLFVDKEKQHVSVISKELDIKVCRITGELKLQKFMDVKEADITEADGEALISHIRSTVLRQGRLWSGKMLNMIRCDYKKYCEVLKTTVAPPRYSVRKIVVFDFETVFDYSTFAAPARAYSVAWTVFDINSPPENFDDYRNSENTRMVKGEKLGDCAKIFFDFIREAPADTKYTLVGFNSSRFDNFILLEQGMNKECVNNIVWVNNSIHQFMLCGRHDCVDIAKLIPGQSLDSACKAFCTVPRKLEGFSHRAPQEAFNTGGQAGLDKWIEENLTKLTEYNINDVLSLAHLTVLIRKNLINLIGIDFLGGKPMGTIASIAMKGLQKVWKDSLKTIGGAKPKCAEEEAEDLYYRSAIRGGRVQNFANKPIEITGERLRMIDVASLYPTVMTGTNRKNQLLGDAKFHYGEFPVGKATDTKEFVSGKPGFYEVLIHSQPSPAIIPIRAKGVPLDWTAGAIVDEKSPAVITSTEVELIRAHGGNVEVLRGRYWEKSTPNLFIAYFEKLVSEKNRQDALKENKSPDYNPALREMCKLLMNSTSGKFLQRNFKEATFFVRNGREKEDTLKKLKEETVIIEPFYNGTLLITGQLNDDLVYKATRAQASQIGVFIYSYARFYMYQLIYSRYPTLYTDTDSAVLREGDYLRFRAENPTLDFIGQNRVKALGDLEEEFGEANATTDAIFIRPKFYLMVPRDVNGNALMGCVKAKVKGVNLKKDKLIIDESIIPPSTSSSTSTSTKTPMLTLYDYYEYPEKHQTKILPLNTLEGKITLFKQILEKGEANVLCSQFVKQRDGFLIRNAIMFKKLQ